MISVPEEIKEAFHKDHCYKNIRIHFPNMERSDICNDQIVKDSVSFKESLCSQNTLKFGLCEASVFECETVGVGNIKGSLIDVSCEIECDSSVTGAEWRTDIQKYVYPVKYGTFEVQEAKRQADMIHRKITAYGGSNRLAAKNSILDYKSIAFADSAIPYEPDIFNTMMMCTQGNALIDDVTLEEVGEYGEIEVYRYVTQQGTGGFSILAKVIRIDSTNEDELYYIPDPGRLPSNYNPGTSGIGVHIFRPEMNTATTSHLRMNLGLYNNGAYFYPYQLMNRIETGSGTGSGISSVYLYIGYRGIYRYPDPLQPYVYTDYFRNKEDCKIYKVNRSNYPSYRISVERKQSIWQGFIIGSIYENGYTFDASSVDYYSLFKDYMELQGKFFTLNRDNAPRIVDIKQQFGLLPDTELYPDTDLYPEGVTGGKLFPQDYQSCWYDDEYTKLFGRITVKYKDTNNKDRIFDYFLNGFSAGSDTNTYQTYDLSGNRIISSWMWAENDIKAICESIAENLEGVRYMPVDFVGRGLPYVESGDTFEILTKSNDSITTIVLNRTITGEQTLTDSYKSV